MAYEIDFLPVGDGERSGDAIALRFGNLNGPRRGQTIVIVDGGTKESGENLVQHVKRFYGTDAVDLVISGHCDADHTSGLYPVVEQLKVGELWIGIRQRTRAALECAYALEKLAKRKGIPVIEPFSGAIRHPAISVLSPSEEFYRTQLAARIQSAKAGLAVIPANVAGQLVPANGHVSGCGTAPAGHL